MNVKHSAVAPSAGMTNPETATVALREGAARNWNHTLAVTGVMVLLATVGALASGADACLDFNDDALMNMAGGFCTVRRAPKKGRNRPKDSAAPASEDESSSSNDASSGGGKSSSFRGRARRATFAIGDTPSGTARRADHQSLGVSLIRQVDTNGMLGLDAFFPPGYIGGPGPHHDAVNYRVTGVTDPNGDFNSEHSHCFLNARQPANGSTTDYVINVEPRVYQVAGNEARQITADLARFGSISPFNRIGMMLNFIKTRTSLLNTMRPSLHHEGWIVYATSYSYQLGLCMARLKNLVQQEEQYFASKSFGLAGTTSEHTHPPWYKRYQRLKGMLDPADANLDPTRPNEWTIADWVEGYVARLSPPNHAGRLVGRTRSKAPILAGPLIDGYRSYFAGKSVDSDGNNTLFIPIDYLEDKAFTTSFKEVAVQDFDYTIATAGVDDWVLSPAAGNQIPTAYGSSVLVETQDGPSSELLHHTLRRNTAVLSTTWHDNLPTVPMQDQFSADFGDTNYSKVIDCKDSVKTSQSMIGHLWGRKQFVGMHNLKHLLSNNINWEAQQTLLNATPNELVLELDAIRDAMPQEAMEYIEAMGVVDNLAPILSEEKVIDYSYFNDEKNLYGKYSINFNPKHPGEHHRGPGADQGISETYYELQDTPAIRQSEWFQLRAPDGLNLMTAAGNENLVLNGFLNGNGGLLGFVDSKVRQRLLPNSFSTGRKMERVVTVPAGKLVEGVMANGLTPVGGAGLLARLAMGTSVQDLDWTMDYPCTDLDSEQYSLDNAAQMGCIIHPNVTDAQDGLANPLYPNIDDDNLAIATLYTRNGIRNLQMTTEGLDNLQPDQGALMDNVYEQKSLHMDQVKSDGVRWGAFTSKWWDVPLIASGAWSGGVVATNNLSNFVNALPFYAGQDPEKKGVFMKVGNTGSGEDWATPIPSGSVVVARNSAVQVDYIAGVQNVDPNQLQMNQIPIQPLSDWVQLDAIVGQGPVPYTSTCIEANALAVAPQAPATAWAPGYRWVGGQTAIWRCSNTGGGMMYFGLEPESYMSIWNQMHSDQVTGTGQAPNYNHITMPRYVVSGKGAFAGGECYAHLGYCRVTYYEDSFSYELSGPQGSLDWIQAKLEAGGESIGGSRLPLLQPDEDWVDTFCRYMIDKADYDEVGSPRVMDQLNEPKRSIDVYWTVFNRSEDPLAQPDGYFASDGPAGNTLFQIDPQAPAVMMPSGHMVLVPFTEVTGNTLPYLEDVAKAHSEGSANLFTGTQLIEWSGSGYGASVGMTSIGSTGAGFLSHPTAFRLSSVRNTGGKVNATPSKIIPNSISNVFHPEYENGDAAVLFASTDPRFRFAWTEGQLGTPFHGDLQGFLYEKLRYLKSGLMERTANPLTDMTRLDRVRFIASEMFTGVEQGREMFESSVTEEVAGYGYVNLTPELIQHIEGQRNYGV